MTDKTLHLSLLDDGSFPTIDEAAWRALVDTTLKGADFERRLVKKTADGVRIEPLYDGSDKAAADSLPGQFPFTRGSSAASDLSRPWDITLRVEHPDLAKSNAIILEGLLRGVSHLDLVLADHSQYGLVIEGLDDVEKLLKDVDLSLVSVGVTGDERAIDVAGMIARIGGPKTVCGSIGYDPLGTLATRGGLQKSVDEALAYGGLCAQMTDKMTDTFASFNVDLRGYDAAGASPALSLAIAMATGVAYLRAGEGAELSIDAAAGQIGFTLTTDTDLFPSIAKLRAARTLWARIVTASGGSDQAAAMKLSVETATSIMAKRDAHTNILRTSIAGFGAAIGGANAISILPFTHALGLPDELARRVARNIHVLLAEESSLGRVMDPAGGSFALENLTRDITNAAWTLFQEIEKQGGMAACLTSGWVQGEIAKLNETRLASLAKRKISITGVSEFPDLDATAVTTADAPTQRIEALDFVVTATAIKPMRLAEAFENLRDKAEAAAKPPSVFLANIGTPADFTARAQFAQNLFEAGGIRAISPDGFTSAEEAASAFKASGAKIACLCSTDTLYKEHGDSFGKALSVAGATKLYLAGNPGDAKPGYEAAGISGFIYMGTDVLAALKDAQSAAGV